MQTELADLLAKIKTRAIWKADVEQDEVVILCASVLDALAAVILTGHGGVIFDP